MTIRKLKENGVECYFEKEGIYTFDGKGELLITIMSSLAQEESRSQRDKAMALYIRTLKKQPTVLTEWNDAIWTVMVEKAIVHRDKSITFVFYNGSEVTVEE